MFLKNMYSQISIFSIVLGVVIDSNLAPFDGKDINGAMAILNIGSFNTFVSKVEDFGKFGNNAFKFQVT